MDCLWGFVCEGGNISNFHLTPQDHLHRLGGWAQFAGIQQYGRMTMAFQLFASSYDPAPGETGTPWSEWAFRDLALALHDQGYSFDRRHAGLIVSGHEGGRLLAVQPLGAQDLVVMAGWSGSFEVEGIALYRHGSRAAKHTAWTSLALQLHLAWDRMA